MCVVVDTVGRAAYGTFESRDSANRWVGAANFPDPSRVAVLLLWDVFSEER